MPLAEVKNRLSEVVDRLEREHGRVVITKHGRPAAMVVPIDAARRLYPENKPGFAELLMAIPHEIPFSRDSTPPREVEF